MAQYESHNGYVNHPTFSIHQAIRTDKEWFEKFMKYIDDEAPSDGDLADELQLHVDEWRAKYGVFGDITMPESFTKVNYTQVAMRLKENFKEFKLKQEKQNGQAA